MIHCKWENPKWTCGFEILFNKAVNRKKMLRLRPEYGILNKCPQEDIKSQSSLARLSRIMFGQDKMKQLIDVWISVDHRYTHMSDLFLIL